MNAPARRTLFIASLVLGLCGAGCVAIPAPDPAPAGPGSARTPTGEVPAPQDALGRVSIGKSTRSDVATQLGPAIVIPFDSGYEVWVYRWRGVDMTPRSATELVVLFDPSGVAMKARVRPGYAPAK